MAGNQARQAVLGGVNFMAMGNDGGLNSRRQMVFLFRFLPGSALPLP
jgi:hypothetical protein